MHQTIFYKGNLAIFKNTQFAICATNDKFQQITCASSNSIDTEIYKSNTIEIYVKSFSTQTHIYHVCHTHVVFPILKIRRLEIE